MVWNKLVPQQGGGALRRWLQVRKTLFELQLAHRTPLVPSTTLSSNNNNSSTFNDNDFSTRYLPPLTLFDFQRVHDKADVVAAVSPQYGGMSTVVKGGWRISDDEVIGGYSRANIQLLQTETETQVQTESQIQSSNYPYLQWKGNIDTRVNPKYKIQRSGFCAIRTPTFPFGGVPIGNKYNALELTCRTDGRIYTVNLKVGSYFPDDLYQGFITYKPDDSHSESETETETDSDSDSDLNSNKSFNQQPATSENRHMESKSKPQSTHPNQQQQQTPSNQFVTLVMPFTDFILTSGGRPREQQRDLDGNIQLEHIGITLMDGVDGPFTFDLKSIRAVNYYHGGIMNDYENDDKFNVDDDNDDDNDGKSLQNNNKS